MQVFDAEILEAEKKKVIALIISIFNLLCKK